MYTYAQNNPISYYDPTGHSIKNLLKKAKDTVTKAASKVTSAVKKTVTSTASTVKKAATTTKNAVVSASKEFRSDWQSGIDQLKQSGTAGKIFASYSEGVVHNLDNTVAGTVQLVKDPLGTVSESVNYFLADPLRNNPVAAAGTFCRDTAKAVYSKDWETVANKVGSATATVAVMGITGTLAEGGASKLFSKGINIDKTISLPMLEMYEYAGVGGFELGVSTVSIPIKASISASKVATAAGVTASAAAGQGIYYSNKFYNQSSGGGVSKGSLSVKNQVESNNSVEITLKYKEGMPQREFNRKANALKELGDKGLLQKAESPVSRNPSVTKAYRQDMIKRIWNQYGKTNPELADRLIDRVTTRMQPDHVWELQLGGPDTAANLKFLDSYTNWDIGTQQIRPQIRNLETGTKIKIKIEK